MVIDAPLLPQALASVELFRGLPSSLLNAAAATARQRRLPARARIFNQGDEEVRAHAVLTGSVRISQSGQDGAEVAIRFICPGEMFGMVGLFTDHRYPGDGTALEETFEVSWGETELRELMARHPMIAINAIRMVGKRLQEAQNRVRELSTQSAERRVAHALLRLARQCGNSTAAGIAIKLPLRRKDIADIAGTTLHTASRILTSLEKAGLLASRNRRVVICQHSKLLRIAER